MALSVAANMKQGLHFWSGDHAGAAVATDEAIEHIGGMAGTAVLQIVYMIGAMSRIQSRPNDRSTARFVRKTLALHRKWAADAPTTTRRRWR